MSDEEYPYVNQMNILYDSLQLIDVKPLVEKCTNKWHNQTLCQVNDSVVRLGILQGEYHWHKHDEEDEFFYVVEGELLVDVDDRTVALKPQQGIMVPRGVIHRTRAPKRTVMLMMEGSSVEPTGD